MFTCASCGDEHTDGPICTLCKNQYDYQCSGITEVGYRRLGSRRDTWCCPKCRLPASPTPSKGGSSPQPAQLDSIQAQLNGIILRLSPLTSLIEDIKSIKEDVRDLKDSIELAHKLIGDFSGVIKGLDNRIGNVEKLAQEVPSLREEVSRLSRDLQDRDQFARANNVEIKGIPLKNREDLYEIAERIGELCKIPIKREEINYIARIPTRVPNADKPIIIAFNNRYRKENLIASSRKLKPNRLSDLGFKDSQGMYYLNDHLTNYNKNLLSKAKILAREKGFKYIWVKHCKIMARKSDTASVFFIRDEKDLKKIV